MHEVDEEIREPQIKHRTDMRPTIAHQIAVLAADRGVGLLLDDGELLLQRLLAEIGLARLSAQHRERVHTHIYIERERRTHTLSEFSIQLTE
jgi:hypothetical protein